MAEAPPIYPQVVVGYEENDRGEDARVLAERIVEQDGGEVRSYTRPAYAAVAARAALRLGDHVEPFLVAENLTDVGNTDLPMRPTTAHLGMNVYY